MPDKKPIHFRSHVSDPRRLRAMQMRSKVESAIREFFVGQDFLEVRTPLLVKSPGMETHIRPFEVKPFGFDSERCKANSADRTSPFFLPTSPEFAMKKLLVGGLPRIFQICPAFRSEPKSSTHLAEFTMLEWYRTRSDYLAIMDDAEALFRFIAAKLSVNSVKFQGSTIHLESKWPRLFIRDFFRQVTGLDIHTASESDFRKYLRSKGLSSDSSATTASGSKSDSRDSFDSVDSWDDLYFRIWLNVVEPALPKETPCIVYGYPASQAALSVKTADADGYQWAKRFEIYALGLELANAFEELTDADEQVRRFESDMEDRTRFYAGDPNPFPKSPMDDDFISALRQGLPPSGGIALGVDRLVMLFADEPEIQNTFWLEPYTG